MTKAKLTDGKLVFATNFEKIGENWVSNPTPEMLASEGFKEVVNQEVDEVISQYQETETQIIISVQKYVENQEII